MKLVSKRFPAITLGLSAALLLASCVTEQQARPAAPPAPPAAPAPVLDVCRSALQSSWTLRRRVVHLAACEWTAFDRPRLLLEQNGWPEAQVEFGPDESALSVWMRVAEYWEAADRGHAAAVRAAAERAGERELWPAWRRAWSAAFISWVMREAGARDFVADPSHAEYLRAALRQRSDSVVDVATYAPVAGDLVCAGRSWGPRDATDFLRRLREETGFFPAHCDVIAEVSADRATLLGGNVKNGVTATETPLREGRIIPTTTRPWAVALRLNEPADPCAGMTLAQGC